MKTSKRKYITPIMRAHMVSNGNYRRSMQVFVFLILMCIGLVGMVGLIGV